MTRLDDERGFSVVEVLVAFAIVAIALTAIFAAIGGQARERVTRELRARVLGLARSHLEAVCQSTDPPPAARSGIYPDGSRWRMRVSPLTISTDVTALPARAAVVRIDLFSRSGHQLGVLRSIKLERTETEQGDRDASP